MDLSLREGQDVATVSSCFFPYSVLFLNIFSLSNCSFDTWCKWILGHLLFCFGRTLHFIQWDESHDNWVELVVCYCTSASFSLGLSDVLCGGSSTEVFANSKCENQITSQSHFSLSVSLPPSLTHFLTPHHTYRISTHYFCAPTQIVVMCDMLQCKMLR